MINDVELAQAVKAARKADENATKLAEAALHTLRVPLPNGTTKELDARNVFVRAVDQRVFIARSPAMDALSPPSAPGERDCVELLPFVKTHGVFTV